LNLCWLNSEAVPIYICTFYRRLSVLVLVWSQKSLKKIISNTKRALTRLRVCCKIGSRTITGAITMKDEINHAQKLLLLLG